MLSELCEEYGAGLEHIEQRMLDVLILPTDATQAERSARLEKARAKLLVHLLNEVALGHLEGRRTPEMLERKARTNEGLARMKDRAGDDTAAARYQQKADALYRAAAELRHGAGGSP